MVRGVCQLPNGSGRKLRVGVFAKGAKAEEAKKAGADIVGAEDLVEQVQKGVIDFDRCIATPDMMPLVGRLGKVLGPARSDAEPEGRHGHDGCRGGGRRGAKGGAVEFRVEKAGIVQAGVGKASFTEKALVENIRAFIDAVMKAKPSGAKGTFVKRMAVDLDHGARREDRARERGEWSALKSFRDLLRGPGRAASFEAVRTCPRLQVRVTA